MRNSLLKDIRKNKAAFAGVSIIVLYILFAIFVPVFSKYDYTSMDTANIFLKPFSGGHILGCDNVGRDIWTREWTGARLSLLIGIVCALMNSVIGTFVGGLSGYRGGKTDMIIMRIVDLLYGIPSLIIAFLIMMVLGSGIRSVIIAICLVGWIGPCRFMRGEVYRIKSCEYIQTSILAGHSNLHIIINDIIPNLIGPLITNFCMAVPGMLFQEAFFSYIGIGVSPPSCSLGSLARESVAYIRTAPFMLISTVAFICTITLAFNFAGEGLSDVLNRQKI